MIGPVPYCSPNRRDFTTFKNPVKASQSFPTPHPSRRVGHLATWAEPRTNGIGPFPQINFWCHLHRVGDFWSADPIREGGRSGGKKHSVIPKKKPVNHPRGGWAHTGQRYDSGEFVAPATPQPRGGLSKSIMGCEKQAETPLQKTLNCVCAQGDAGRSDDANWVLHCTKFIIWTKIKGDNGRKKSGTK